jgi:serine/threonine protein kinase
MSPESIKEKKYSEKTDAYSFAVLMWEILTRKEPYEDEPLLQIALRVASQGALPPPHHTARVRRRACRVVSCVVLVCVAWCATHVLT